MTFTKKEGRLFLLLCLFDCSKTVGFFLLTAHLAADPAKFWKDQLPSEYAISTSLSDLLLIACVRVSLLCGIFVTEGDASRKVPLKLAYVTFRLLTLVGSIYLACKLAFFAYEGGGAGTSAVLMILGSLIALWVESVVPYVLTAARLSTPEDAAAPTLALLPQDGAEKGVPEVLVVAKAAGKEEDRIPK